MRVAIFDISDLPIIGALRRSAEHAGEKENFLILINAR